MKFNKILAAAAIAVTMAGGAASALTVSMNGSAAGGYEQLKITAPDAGKDGDRVNAGAFSMTDTTAAPDNVLGDFIAFCLDLGAWISKGGGYNYDVTDTPFSNSLDLVANGAVDRIQAIFDANYSNAVATDNRVTSAGFQVALWNAVYDDDWTVSGGTGFSAYGNDSVTNQANAYLAAAQTYAGGKKWTLSYLESTDTDPRHQNLVTAAPVPLPAAGLMLLGALAGLGTMRRRRKAA